MHGRKWILLATVMLSIFTVGCEGEQFAGQALQMFQQFQQQQQQQQAQRTQYPQQQYPQQTVYREAVPASQQNNNLRIERLMRENQLLHEELERQRYSLGQQL